MKKIYIIFMVCLLAGASMATSIAYSPNCSISVSASISGTGGSGGGGSSICPGTAVSLASTVSGGTAPYTYLWTPGMTLNNPTSANPVATLSVTTTYTLSVTDNAGCTGTASVTVTVGASPVIQPDSLLQEYLTGRPLTATGGTPPYTYTFSPAVNTNSLLSLPATNTTFTITVTGANGCSSTDYANFVPLENITYGSCTTIFISEYIQDTVHHDDAIELYNPTPGSINIDNYYLFGTTNGSLYATPFFIALHGTIAPYHTFLIANTLADTSLTNKASMLSDSLNFGGKDIVSLIQVNISPPTLSLSLLDEVGTISPLPTDSGWAVGSGSTKNHTLTRQISVTQGSTNWAVCQTEWNVHSRGTFSYIGTYCNVCSPADAKLYLTLGNDSVSCGNPSYFSFDILISADSAKSFNNCEIYFKYPMSEFGGDDLSHGIGFSRGPEFNSGPLNDYSLAISQANDSTLHFTLGNSSYVYSPAGAMVDSIPKVLYHFSLEIKNSCQTGYIGFVDTSITSHNADGAYYTISDRTFDYVDSTLDTFSLCCPYLCNPYLCDSTCCAWDSNGNCITYCYLTCDTTYCYDTTWIYQVDSVFHYSHDTNVEYSITYYTDSLPTTMGCPPVIEPLDPVNAGTNDASDPPKSSILTINGANFGNGKGLIEVPDANKGGGSHSMILDTNDILSWTNSKIIIRMPSVVFPEDTTTPGSGYLFMLTDCGGRDTATLKINYNIMNEAISGKKLRYNMAMSNDSNSIVFRCDTSISNHSRIYADVLQAIETWNCYTGINWKMGNDTILENTAQDGVSVIYFNNSLPPGVLMGTSTYIDNSCNDMSDSMAYVHEADIAISRIPQAGYNWNYDASDTALPGINYYFYDALLHELGHAHLLNHVDDNTSVMYWQANVHTRRNLLTGAYPGPQTLYAGFDVVNTSAANSPSCVYRKLVPSSRPCVDPTLAVGAVSENQYQLGLYPNPVSNQDLTISYELTQDSYVQFKIIDYRGREVVILANEHKPPGNYKEQINTDNFANGIYLFIANINGSIQTIKFIKL